MLSKTLATFAATRPLTATPLAAFGHVSRYVGPNDHIRQERRQKRKYGMKRHFYDKEKFDDMADPDKQ